MINYCWLTETAGEAFPRSHRLRVRFALPSYLLALGLSSACSDPAAQNAEWAPTNPGAGTSGNNGGAGNGSGSSASDDLAPLVPSNQPATSGDIPGAPPVSPSGPAVPSVPDGSGAGNDLRTISISNAPYRVLSRLTGRQYVTAAGQLLGIDAANYLSLIPEIAPNAGYSNSGYAQSQPYDLVLAFDTAAKTMTDEVGDWTAVVGRFGGCAELACINEFLAAFGERAFRRPLSTQELDAFQPVLAAAAANELGYLDTVALLVRAILQSPEFLYLFEDTPLTGHQLAARLAFFITDGPPDDELLADARSGTLGTGDRLSYHVDRLLTLQGDSFARSFAYDYLGLRKAFQRTVDVDRATITSLVDSAEATFAALIASDAPIGALLTTRSFVTNAVTAAYLGADATATSVDAAASNGFMGLVTHPATLIAMSNAFEGSMVSRGQFLAHQMLCIPPTPPPSMAFNPDDVGVALPPDPTQRDEAEARLQDTNCLGCHIQFEPYAFALNKWGGDGRYYEDPRLNDSGPITTSLGSFEFSSFEDFLPIVAESEQFQRCMADHFVRYGLRHTEYPSEVVDAVLAQARQSGASVTFRSLVRAVVQQPVFAAQ